MTAQISDSFRYRGKDYSLAGISGPGLFDPAQQGVRAVAWMSACWRGFYCAYEIADETLFLTRINLGLSAQDRVAADCGDGPSLFGKVPRPFILDGLNVSPLEETWKRRKALDYIVDDLREIIPFTAGALLGDDFIQEMYVHMGFHPAYKFRVVHELVFEAGRLREEHDRSAQMAEFRAMISEKSLRPGDQASRAEIEAWIGRCFSQEYKGFRA